MGFDWVQLRPQGISLACGCLLTSGAWPILLQVCSCLRVCTSIRLSSCLTIFNMFACFHLCTCVSVYTCTCACACAYACACACACACRCVFVSLCTYQATTTARNSASMHHPSWSFACLGILPEPSAHPGATRICAAHRVRHLNLLFRVSVYPASSCSSTWSSACLAKAGSSSRIPHAATQPCEECYNRALIPTVAAIASKSIKCSSPRQMLRLTHPTPPATRLLPPLSLQLHAVCDCGALHHVRRGPGAAGHGQRDLRLRQRPLRRLWVDPVDAREGMRDMHRVSGAEWNSNMVKADSYMVQADLHMQCALISGIPPALSGGW